MIKYVNKRTNTYDYLSKLIIIQCVCSSFMSVFLDVCSVLCVFYSTTCVCVCYSFYGPLHEFCDAAGNGGAPG